MTLTEMKALHRARLTHFIYVPDQEQYQMREHWPDREQIPLSGEILKGDCDDFAHACYWDLLDKGTESNLIFCQTETGGYHLVCECDGWIFDNRMRTVLRIKDVPYIWHKSGRPNSKWYKILSEEK